MAKTQKPQQPAKAKPISDLCNDCVQKVFTCDVGVCTDCEKYTSSGSFTLCRNCAIKKNTCAACLKPLTAKKP